MFIRAARGRSLLADFDIRSDAAYEPPMTPTHHPTVGQKVVGSGRPEARVIATAMAATIGAKNTKARVIKAAQRRACHLSPSLH